MRLDGKKIIITGATGIARSAAGLFTGLGAHVHVISLVADECVALAEEVDLAGWSVADLSDEQQAVSATAEATAGLGQVDGVFAVAGGSGRRLGDGPLDQVSLDAWRATLDLNLTTSFLPVREALRVMLGQGSGGSVVLVSSVLARYPVAGLFATHAYAAAKGAQVSLARSMAARYAGDGIRVNVVAPGLVRTPMSERAANDPATVEFARSKQPLVGGFLEPEDVASAAAFLLSDATRGLTGQILEVDGGWGVTETGG